MRILLGLGLLVALGACGGTGSEVKPEGSDATAADVAGRWDATVRGGDSEYPTWFELTRQDGVWSGSFVGRFGSARPISEIDYTNGVLTFSLPSQYEQGQSELRFEGRLKDGQLAGTTNGPEGAELRWTAVRAPELAAPAEPKWGEPIELFNGKDLTGWKPRHPELPNQWAARDGVLDNASSGSDLMTEQSFQNFKLHIEVLVPEKSNSGIYLRGRHEVQVEDSFGKDPGSLLMGGVYGFLTPSVNAAKPAGEWQTYDITLLGRWVTIELNGQTIIDRKEIPGITGGAIDSKEGQPGPILLQGDHGPISYRNVVLTPGIG